MTPQERDLITELFDRLASLEGNPRDPDAEAAIRDGLRRAPNAIYAVVQTVLVQDEALKAANARIQDYEQGGEPQQPRSFLDSMRDSLFGGAAPRGSVPRIPQGGVPQGGLAAAPTGYYGDARPSSGYGSSFLGTAAATAAGVIGGSLLMDGIRSALGSHHGGPFASAFDQLGGRGTDAPWGNDQLARDAGINDIGGRRAGFGDFDQAPQDATDDTDDSPDDFQDDGGFDTGGDSDTA